MAAEYFTVGLFALPTGRASAGISFIPSATTMVAVDLRSAPPRSGRRIRTFVRVLPGGVASTRRTPTQVPRRALRTELARGLASLLRCRKTEPAARKSCSLVAKLRKCRSRDLRHVRQGAQGDPAPDGRTAPATADARCGYLAVPRLAPPVPHCCGTALRPRSQGFCPTSGRCRSRAIAVQA
jgi:hypothetical protein